MKIKLPVILSAMIAALAIPGTLASEADAAKGGDAAAETTAAPEAGAATEAATQPAEEKKATKKRGKRKHRAPAAEATDDGAPKKHHKKHRRGHYADGSGGHVANVWDLPYDYAIKQQNGDSSGCSGDSDDHGKKMPSEEPGYPGPNVPRGM